MCRFLGPNKNFLYLVTYFFFQSSPTFWVIGKLKTLNSLLDVFGPMAFYLFFNFFGNSVQSRLKKEILMKALLISLFCFTRSWTRNGILDFDLIVFSGRLLWIPMLESVRMMDALLMMLIGSGLSEEIRLRIWSCRIATA